MNISNLSVGIENFDTSGFIVAFAECNDGVGVVSSMTIELVIRNLPSNYKVSDFSHLRGSCAVLLATDTSGEVRKYSGIIYEVSVQLAIDGKVSGLKIAALGWPRGAGSYRKAYRFFQQKSVVQIATEIFQDEMNRVNAVGLDNQPKQRIYQVQYGESDQEFISRLILREQLLFRISASADDDARNFGSQLHVFSSLTDLPVDPRPVKFSPSKSEVAGMRSGIFDLAISYQEAPDVLAAAGYSTPQPNLDLRASASTQESETGKWIEVGVHGIYHDLADGQARADHQLQARRAPLYRFASDLLAMAAGKRYSINHLTVGADPTTELAVISSRQVFKSIDKFGGWLLEGEFEAVAPTDPYEPQAPAAPVLPGLLRGVVVARKDGALAPGYARLDNDDNVDTDKFGRIRVRILWHGEARKEEAAATDAPWLRLMTPWAGQRAGFIAMPRAGQEVIVSFVNGDADLPVVMGCLYGESDSNPSSQPWSMARDSKWVGMGTRSKDGVSQFLRLDATAPTEDNVGVEMYSASRMRLEAAQKAEFTSPDISIGNTTPALSPDSPEFKSQFPEGPIGQHELNQIYQKGKSTTLESNSTQGRQEGDESTTPFTTKEIRLRSTNLAVDNTTMVTATAANDWTHDKWKKSTYEGKFEAGNLKVDIGAIKKTTVGLNFSFYTLNMTNTAISNTNFGVKLDVGFYAMTFVKMTIKNKPFEHTIKGFDYSKKVVETEEKAVKSEKAGAALETKGVEAKNTAVEAKQNNVNAKGTTAASVRSSGIEVVL